MFKFKVGQKVIFYQGQAALDIGSPEEIEAIVRVRYDDLGTLIYQIDFNGFRGGATVLEEELNPLVEPPSE